MGQSVSNRSGEIPRYDYAPSRIVDELMTTEGRVMLFGQPGIGKSTLAAALGHELEVAGQVAACIRSGVGAGPRG
jgi:DNA replication protein DnaC